MNVLRQAANFILNLATAGGITATQNSAAVNAGSYQEAVLYLNTTAASGTTPTLNVKLQTSYNGTDWYDIPSAAIVQVTGVIKSIPLIVTGGLGQYVRAVQTIGGTTPSFTYDLDLVLK